MIYRIYYDFIHDVMELIESILQYYIFIADLNINHDKIYCSLLYIIEKVVGHWTNSVPRIYVPDK